MMALARAHVRGLPVSWRDVLADSGGRHVALPTYAFRRVRYWPDERPAAFMDMTAFGGRSVFEEEDEGEEHVLSEAERKELVRGYFQRLNDGDVDGAVAMFAEDGRMEDPVGSRPYEGREAVRDHIAAVVGTDVEVTMGEPCAAQDGKRVAVPLLGSMAQPADPTGPRVKVNCVDVIRVGDDGLIEEVLVFWGLSDVAV